MNKTHSTDQKKRGVPFAIAASLVLLLALCLALQVFTRSVGQLTIASTETPTASLAYAPTISRDLTRLSTRPPMPTFIMPSTPSVGLNCRSESVCNPMFVPGRGTTCIYTIQLVCDRMIITVSSTVTATASLTPTPSPTVTCSPTATFTPTPTPEPLVTPIVAAGASAFVILVCAILLIGIFIWAVRRESK